MRIHLKHISPKIHGMITEHKASHNHKNLDETVSCLIETAVFVTTIQDDNQRLKAELERLTLAMRSKGLAFNLANYQRPTRDNDNDEML